MLQDHSDIRTNQDSHNEQGKRKKWLEIGMTSHLTTSVASADNVRREELDER